MTSKEALDELYKLDFSLYDMIILEDYDGSIYQENIHTIIKKVDCGLKKILRTNKFDIKLSLDNVEIFENERGHCPNAIVREVWHRVDNETFKRIYTNSRLAGVYHKMSDELEKITDCDCESKLSYEDVEHQYSVLRVELRKTIDALLYSLMQSGYEQNCNLEKVNHYMELYLEEGRRADKLFDELRRLRNDK